MSTFSDIATQTAFGNSIDIKRYHGNLSTILVGGLTLANLLDANNVVYLAPIPWHARIVSISVCPDTTVTPGTAITGNFFMRGMQKKSAKTATELGSLDYTAILGTTADYSSAIANTSGYTGNIAIHQTLSGATLANNNTTEIPLYGDAVTMLDTEQYDAGKNYDVILPFKGRICTPAEAMCYYATLNRGSETATALKYAANALEHVKDQYGMLTWKATGGASDAANAIIRIDYVSPAPSAVAPGKIARNTVL